MIKTKVTEMLGIKYPIICGTMMNLTVPSFAAACTNTGALGILASAIYREPEPLREAIQETKKLAKEPFAVNMNMFPALQPPDQISHLKAMIDEGVKIIETSGHKAPADYVGLFKEHDITWMHKCAGVRYAQTAAKLGADIIEVVGWENGGATGRFDVGTLVLTPATVDAIDVPVVAGGGIADGRGVVAALSLGAEAAIIGSRLLMTKECPIHDNLKQALCEASIYDTTVINKRIRNEHRVWANVAAQKVIELEASDATDMEIYKASSASGDAANDLYTKGDLTAATISVGQGVGLACDVPTAKVLIDRIMKEAEEIISKFTLT